MLHVYPSVVDGEGFWDAAVCLLLGPCSRAVSTLLTLVTARR